MQWDEHTHRRGTVSTGCSPLPFPRTYLQPSACRCMWRRTQLLRTPRGTCTPARCYRRRRSAEESWCTNATSVTLHRRITQTQWSKTRFRSVCYAQISLFINMMNSWLDLYLDSGKRKMKCCWLKQLIQLPIYNDLIWFRTHQPSLSAALTLTPNCTRNLTISVCPAQTALCRAVIPSSFGWLGSSTCRSNPPKKPSVYFYVECGFEQSLVPS